MHYMTLLLNLDKRCQDILKRIIYAGGYVKIQDLADEMQISRRSAYYDLNKINEWLQEKNIALLVQDRTKGVFVNQDQVQKIQAALSNCEIEENYHVFTPDERKRIEICAITFRTHPMYIDHFMELCQVSRNTIINDLKLVMDFLRKNCLSLTYDMKNGYRIRGDVIKKRAIFFMMFPAIWKYYDRGIIKTENLYVMKERLTKLKYIEKALDAEYVSGTLETLAAFISTIDKRNDHLSFSDMDEEEIMDTREYRLVETYFHAVNHYEKIYISLHLLGSRLQTLPVRIMKEQGETYEIAKHFVQEFEQLSCICFHQKEGLIHAINAHLKTSFYRYRYGIQLGNPMLDSIKTEYEDLFELTKQSCRYLEERLGAHISDAEVAYITLHFCAFLTSEQPLPSLRILIICPNGLSTGNMLRSEVKMLVPQASDITTLPLSSYEVGHDFDVVISTIVLPEEKKLIVVHPIVTDQDRVNILRNCVHREPNFVLAVNEIMKLAASYIPPGRLPSFKEDLQEYYASNQITKVTHRSYGASVSYYLKKSHIQIERKATTWEAAIRLCCAPLLQEGSILDTYVDAILYDQKVRGLHMFIMDGVVLAHAAIEKGSLQVDVSLTIFKEPVVFLNQKLANIIITISAEDQNKHIHLLNDILHIFSKRKYFDHMITLQTCEEVCAYIQQLIAS